MARRVAPLGVHREELVIAATHTHHGPGNYLSAGSFNAFGSTYPGFDKRLFRFLARQVTRAIEMAKEDAHAASRRTTYLVLHTGRLPQILRNRAPFVFELNADRDEIMGNLGDACAPCIRTKRDPECDFEEDCEPAGGWEPIRKCPRLRAVDRNVTVLDIRRDSPTTGARVGALVFFAAHPTVLWHDAPLYSSDFAGWAMDWLEKQWAVPGLSDPPVVGFFNGPEGDITARRLDRDMKDVASIGRQLATAVDDLVVENGCPIEGEVRITTRQADPDLKCHPTCRASIPGWGDVRLAKSPTFGVAAPGGGEGDRHDPLPPGIQAGSNDRAGRRARPQAEVLRLEAPQMDQADGRRGPGGFFSLFASRERGRPRVLPPRDVSRRADDRRRVRDPGQAPFRARRCGDHRPRERVRRVRNDGRRVRVAGLRGGFDDLGPPEANFLGCTLANLLLKPQALADSVPETVFRPGEPVEKWFFGPERCGERRAAVDEELDKLLVDETRRPARSLPYFTWKEVLPSKTSTSAPSPIAKSRCSSYATAGGRPAASSVRECEMRWTTTDRWENFVSILVDAADEECCAGPGCVVCRKPDVFACRKYAELTNEAEYPALRYWAAIWRAPIAGDALSGGPFAFRVRDPARSETALLPALS